MAPKEEEAPDPISLVLEGRPRDLGDGFQVRRTLPSMQRRTVGPFTFFDHFGPVRMPPGQGLDVRPHPHIGLATVTYLFEGEIVHRDSLGSVQTIRAGDVNWMVAGRGVVHSERSSPGERERGPRLHGLQLWVALPLEKEECAPTFEHVEGSTLPVVRGQGTEVRVILGAAYGVVSPVATPSETLYVEARLEQGAVLDVPLDVKERAAYVVEGTVGCGLRRFEAGEMIVFRGGVPAQLRAVESARVMLVGGARLEGDRFLWWNFVASSKELLERAKRDWRERSSQAGQSSPRFPTVPGDDVEYIPLPET
jgi:redox-sensitive bicupin YhaK (pirin superfamily)